MDHRTVIVHDKKSYIVTLVFEMIDGNLCVSVKSCKPTNILSHEVCMPKLPQVIEI